MPPSKIMFIRHGEKPEVGVAAEGVTTDGVDDDHSLIVRGWTRAGALIAYFSSNHGDISIPDYVFAATPDTSHKSLHGQRPSQTIQPLCAFRGPAADETYAVGQEVALANAIDARNDIVLVCWEHHAISDIVKEKIDPTFTPTWPNRFDLVWIFTHNGSSYDFTTANQHLLSDDA